MAVSQILYSESHLYIHTTVLTRTPVCADCMRAHMLRYRRGSLALSTLLTASEVAWLDLQLHKPIAAARVLSNLLATCTPLIEPICLVDVQQHLSNYLAYQGACERIQATPIPLAYSRHTVRLFAPNSFFVLFFCFFGYPTCIS